MTGDVTNDEVRHCDDPSRLWCCGQVDCGSVIILGVLLAMRCVMILEILAIISRVTVQSLGGPVG